MNPVVLASPHAPRHRPVDGPLDGPLTFAPSDRLLIVAPHPDDESLAAAGLLQQARRAGADLRVVYVTDGENNPWAQLLYEGRWPVRAADRRRWGARRRVEALHAIDHLGVERGSVKFLGFPDQGLTDDLARGDEKLLGALIGELRAAQPTVVAIPSLSDQHPDHSAIAVMARLALHRGAMLLPPPRVLRYLVHPPARCETGTAWVRLGAEARESKRRAILCHRSQLRWRRTSLLATVREVEEFLTAGPECPQDSPHPIERARFEGRNLVVELAKHPRPAFGPTVLRVLFETTRTELVVATLPVRSRPQPAFRLESSRGRSCGEVVLTYEPSSRQAILRFTAMAPLQQAYLKLDRPRERRLGIFDEAGWRAVPVDGEE